MECKTVPKIPETKVDLITQLDRKQGTSCSRYGFKLCFGILSCVLLAYCVYLHYNYINLLKEVQNIKENSEQYNQPEAMVKRHMDLDDRRHRRDRRRRELQTLKQKIADLENLPMLHMNGNGSFGIGGTSNLIRRACRYDQQCALWTHPSGNPMEFEYKDSKVIGVKITRAGFYYVYSQISVSGLKNEDNIPSSPAFGYETIKINNMGIKTLSRSFVTQDERGQWYDQVDEIGPVDTLNQMGIFRLNCGDVISVRSYEQVNIHNVKFLPDQHASYFGLMLLRPKGLNDHACY